MGVQYLSGSNPDGVSVCKSTSDLVCIYGTVPVAQRANANQGAVATTAITSVATTGAVSTGAYGFAQTQADGIVTAVNALIVRVEAMRVLQDEMRNVMVPTTGVGLMKGSA